MKSHSSHEASIGDDRQRSPCLPWYLAEPNLHSGIWDCCGELVLILCLDQQQGHSLQAQCARNVLSQPTLCFWSQCTVATDLGYLWSSSSSECMILTLYVACRPAPQAVGLGMGTVMADAFCLAALLTLLCHTHQCCSATMDAH